MKRTEIEGLLPEVFQRTAAPGSPLFGLLDVMDALQAPSEKILEHLELFFSPYRTPDRFVPFLARWVDLERLLVDALEPGYPAGPGRLRELVAAAAYLSRWRGTASGLECFLETATGMKGYQIVENPPGKDGKPHAFHLLIKAPKQAETWRSLIERIVTMEKPAYVTYELQFY